MDAPLQGLRILEASGDVAVRYCGRLFAQLGAEVVRAAATVLATAMKAMAPADLCPMARMG